MITITELEEINNQLDFASHKQLGIKDIINKH